MKALATVVGTFVLVCYVLSWLDVLDFYLCIGKRGTCVERSEAKPVSRRAT
ncbi:hypothetical protein BH10PSE18_BH10PSE18_18690 [soil metagenome]